MRKFGIAARAVRRWVPVGVGVPSIVKRSLPLAPRMIATGVLTCLQYHLRIPIVRTRQFKDLSCVTLSLQAPCKSQQVELHSSQDTTGSNRRGSSRCCADADQAVERGPFEGTFVLVFTYDSATRYPKLFKNKASAHRYRFCETWP